LLAGERFSKSSGVKLDLNEAMDRYGPDALRYFLLREVPFDGDGNFSWERFDDRYNADLANAFGNLASRTVAMVERYFEGIVPSAPATEVDKSDLADLADYHAAMDGTKGYLPNEALQAVWKTVARGNEYVDRQAPWKLAKDPAQRDELALTLASLIRQLARQAICLFPFMPVKSQELWESLGGPGRLETRKAFDLEKIDVTGWKVTKGTGLFPKPDAK
jgi:methionyl-tRNA synthetase